MAKCLVCQLDMPEERLELGFMKCIKCSDQSTYVGAPHISGKTGHDITLIKNTQENTVAVERAFNLGNCIIRRATPKAIRKKN
jgi:hypothetical protein